MTNYFLPLLTITLLIPSLAHSGKLVNRHPTPQLSSVDSGGNAFGVSLQAVDATASDAKGDSLMTFATISHTHALGSDVDLITPVIATAGDVVAEGLIWGTGSGDVVNMVADIANIQQANAGIETEID